MTLAPLGPYTFGYTVIRPGQPPVRSDPQGETVAMRASGDGAFVLAQWLFEPGATVKAWPLEDFSHIPTHAQRPGDRRTILHAPADGRV